MASSSEEDGSRKDPRLAHKDRLRKKIWQIKKELGCEICGYNEHPAALQFDHLEPSNKEFTISRAISDSIAWQRIEAEIEKCRVLCANCHAIHTHESGHHAFTRVGTT